MFSSPSELPHSPLGLARASPAPSRSVGWHTISLSDGHFSQPLLTDVLCPSARCLLPSAPPDTCCLRLPAAVGGHTSAGPGLLPQRAAPTHHGWFAGAQDSSSSKMGVPGRRLPADLYPTGSLRTRTAQLLEERGLGFELIRTEKWAEGGSLGTLAKAQSHASGAQEALPSLGTPNKAKPCSTGLSQTHREDLPAETNTAQPGLPHLEQGVALALWWGYWDLRPRAELIIIIVALYYTILYYTILYTIYYIYCILYYSG